MSSKKVTVGKSKEKLTSVVDHSPLFAKENYILMIVGGLVMALGMLVMAGGKNADPNVFNYKEVYSKTRITLAPILIVLGLAIEIFALFKKPKAS